MVELWLLYRISSLVQRQNTRRISGGNRFDSCVGCNTINLNLKNMKLFNFKKTFTKTTDGTKTEKVYDIDITVARWLFAMLLVIVLMGLRLFGVCNVSWWIITMPIWIGWALKIIGVVLIGVFGALFITFASKEKQTSIINSLKKKEAELKERLDSIELEDSSTTHDK